LNDLPPCKDSLSSPNFSLLMHAALIIITILLIVVITLVQKIASRSDVRLAQGSVGAIPWRMKHYSTISIVIVIEITVGTAVVSCVIVRPIVKLGYCGFIVSITVDIQGVVIGSFFFEIVDGVGNLKAVTIGVHNCWEHPLTPTDGKDLVDCFLRRWKLCPSISDHAFT
jgi:hypothetical protein